MNFFGLKNSRETPFKPPDFTRVSTRQTDLTNRAEMEAYFGGGRKRKSKRKKTTKRKSKKTKRGYLSRKRK
jgi:hypothetical protein